MDTSKLDARVENLKKRGVALPRNKARARLEALSMHQMASTPGDLRATIGDTLTDSPNRESLTHIRENTRLIREMGAQRTASSRRTGTTSSGSDAFAAIPRFYDPMEYWDLSGLPWNMADEGHRHKLHKWLRLYYATHYLVPILIDIFTRFPLVGMELESKDKQLAHFYEDLFFDQLDYQEFLVQLGREYWTVGEAFALGSFDEDLGIWEREELINPEDVVVNNFPLLGTKELKLVPPDYLKKLASEKSPPKEFKMLEMNFPELLPYLRNNEHIPISGVLLKQVANTLTSWDDHGTPILLRGLRTLIHEEKLLASQDAIAERLYSPLILAKLGIQDLGDNEGPWFPSPEELESFRDDLDLALASDFRVIVHHFALEMENVFGREQMPRLGDDFDRIERRVMQIFGVNPSLLSAGSMSQPYASSALQAEFLNQILRTFQRYLRKHFESRAYVVAEAQGHYEYEKKGETRVPIYEEVVEYNENGEREIKERKKLLIPELTFKTLDLRDEATERQFLQTLRAMGVPIPDEKLMVGIDRDFEELVDEYDEELVFKTIHQQEAKMKTYTALRNRGLPIPADLKAEVESALMGGPQQPTGAGAPGLSPAGPGPHQGPGGNIVMPPPPPGIAGGPGGVGVPGLGPGGMGGPVPGGGPPPAGPMAPGAPGMVPGISMERRPGAPTPLSSVQSNGKPDDWKESKDETTQEKKEKDDKTVEKLPRSSKRIMPESKESPKKYSIIDPDAEPIDESDESEPS